MVDGSASHSLGHYDLELCRSLASLKEIEVHLVVPKDFKQKSREIDITAYSAHMNKHLNKPKRIFEYLKWLTVVFHLTEKFKPQIIHWQMGFFLLLDFVLNSSIRVWCKNIIFVVTVHEVKAVNRTFNNTFLRNRFFSFFDSFIFHSEDAKNEFIEWYNSSNLIFTIIPHGPLLGRANKTQRQDVFRKYEIPMNEPVVLSLGSINTNKNYKACLTLISEMQKIQSNINYIIAGFGDNQYATYIRNEIQKTTYPSRIKFINRELSDEEVVLLHQISDFSLLLYKNCTTSGAVVHSLCLGTPVICNDLPGLASVVKDYDNGLIACPESPQRTARKIIDVINKPQLMKRLRDNALDSHKDVTWNEIAWKHFTFYKQLLED